MITPDRWARFFELVRETRRLQVQYRRTMDARLRRQAESAEVQLDAEVGWLAADLAAAAVAVEAEMSAEGGAA